MAGLDPMLQDVAFLFLNGDKGILDSITLTPEQERAVAREVARLQDERAKKRRRKPKKPRLKVELKKKPRPPKVEKDLRVGPRAGWKHIGHDDPERLPDPREAIRESQWRVCIIVFDGDGMVSAVDGVLVQGDPLHRDDVLSVCPDWHEMAGSERILVLSRTPVRGRQRRPPRGTIRGKPKGR